MTTPNDIPRQAPLPWKIIFRVSFAGMRRRLVRSIVTVSCVLLALAFLSYMLSLANLNQALVELNAPDLNMQLQSHGVNIFAETQTDPMNVLLIALALITCTVGIANSMLMSVTERVREIGTLKCLGARDGFIVKTYLVESTLQGLCGAIVGIIIGCLVAVLVSVATYPGYLHSCFPVGAILETIFISLVCGLCIAVGASIWPAHAAAQKRPVDALRVEE